MTDLPADAGAGLKALGINCTLKKSPEVSNTEALMLQVLGILDEHGVETELLRPVDYAIKFGVSPEINAISTIVVALTALAILIA